MDFSGFAGNQRPLTWTRTPIHDRDYKKQVENGALESSNRTRDLPAFCIRQLSDRIFSRPCKKQNGSSDFALLPGRSAPSSSAYLKRDRAHWHTIHFVVGGQHFQSPEWMFSPFPSTLLGNLEGRKIYYHKKRSCYEFPNILPDVFTAVLEYYRTSQLTRPERLTLNFFLEQIEVFDLEEAAINLLLKKEGVHRSKRRAELSCEASEKWTKYRHLLWTFIENPRSSVPARLFSCFSLFMTALSVTLFVIETLPELADYSLTGKNTLEDAFRSPIFTTNIVCFIFFTLELCLRLALCPSKRDFFRQWTNWTDAISILPYLMTFVLLGLHYGQQHVMPISLLTAIRACRLFLLTRVFGTSRHHRQQWIIILARTLWNNIETLFVLFFLMVICTIGFGGVVYAFEGAGSDNPTFATIPWGMWWAVVTLTTVGYGDIAPKRAPGQCVAIACGCVGLMFIGFVLESVTYEYHRLMKSNSQYRRYLAEIDIRRSPNSGSALMRKPTTCQRNMMLLADTDDIHITIHGADFFLSLTDVNRHPNSLLGHPSKRACYFNPTTGSYFFPRNQDIFPAIHHYYSCPGTVLKRPPFITLERFIEEVEFFQLSPQAVIDFLDYEGIRLVDEKQPTNRYLRYWYLVLEHPRFNFLSRIIMVCSLCCTGLFILNIVLESLPSLLDFTCSTSLTEVNDDIAVAIANSSNITASFGLSDTFRTRACPNELAFFVIETLCTGWFFLELVARFLVSPSKRNFLKQTMNWIDLIIISPYIFSVIQFVAIPSSTDRVSQLFSFFRTMRLLRLVSIVKFSRYFQRIQMIFAILVATWIELLMLCYFMVINAVLFGTIIYLVEMGSQKTGDFTSIPRAMYWAFITMLTIGYGDMIPSTAGGKIVAAGVSILGIVFWTLPMTLISDHFANYRRLYEGQDFLMMCLTRMYDLLDKETSSRAGRRASTVPTCIDAALAIQLPEETHFSDENINNSSPPHLLLDNSFTTSYRRSSTKTSLQQGMEFHSVAGTKMTRRFSRVEFY